jgi:hypothetical protein
LVVKILQQCGARSDDEPGAVAGPKFWQVPVGRSLVEVAGSLDGSSKELNLEEFSDEDE